MPVVAWSVVMGLLGALAAWGATGYWSRRSPHRSPHLYWVLGVAGLLPGWLVGFVGLLGASTARHPEVTVTFPFLLSSAAALFGVILTDAAVRRFQESGQVRRPVAYWLLGVAALFPAWCIALLGLAWTRP